MSFLSSAKRATAIAITAIVAIVPIGVDVAPAQAAYVPEVSFQQSTISPLQTAAVYLNGARADWRPAGNGCIAVGYTDATHTVSNFVKTGHVYWSGGHKSTIGGTKKTLSPAFSDSVFTTTNKLSPRLMTYAALNPGGVRTGEKFVVAFYPDWDCSRGIQPTPTIASIEIAGPNAVAPATPAGFRASAVTKTEVTLSWDSANSDSRTVTEYNLYLDGAIVSGGTPIAGTTTTQTFNNLAKGSTYTFGIEAVSDGIEGVSVTGISARASVTVTTLPVSPIPAAVSTVGVTDIAYNRATVQWVPVPGAEWYEITGIGAASEWSATEAQFSGLTSETDYTGVIRAGNDGGWSVEKSFTFTTAVDPVNLPHAPSSVIVSAVTQNSAVLTWSAAVNATSYNVLVNGAIVARGITGLTYTATGLPPGTSITMAVEGVSNKGVGNRSTAGSFLTQPDPRAGQAPLGILIAWCPADSGFNHCYWSQAESATSYKLYLNDALIATVDSLSYDIMALDVGNYSLKIEPVNPFGTGPAKVISFDVTEAPNVSNFPINNIVVSGISDTSATLTWDAVPGATSYGIRQPNVYSPSDFASTNTNSVTLTLKAGRTYAFDVVAYNSVSNTRTQSPVRAPWIETTGTFVPLPAPKAVTNARTRNSQTTSVGLIWDQMPNATSYSVVVGSGAAQETSMPGMQLTGLTKATKYTVKIRPLGESPTTAVTSFTFTTAGGAGTVTGSVTATGGTKLTWVAATGATGYKIYVAGKLVKTLGKVLTYTIATPVGPTDDLVAVKVIKAGGVETQLGTYRYVQGTRVTFGTLSFPTNSAVLSVANKSALNALAASLTAHGFSQFTIDVKVKKTATLNATQAAARATARATAIKTYLVTKVPQYVQIVLTSGSSTAADSNTIAALVPVMSGP